MIKLRPQITLIVLMLLLSFLSEITPQKIPSNEKSREVVNRISEILTKDLAAKNLLLGSNVYIKIFKESKELEIWIKKRQSFKLFKTYLICSYGNGTLGPKLEEDDGQAPEGFYSISASFLNPYSDYYLSMGVGYPNRYDIAHSRTGSAIMIHGNCVSIGCFAMGDSSIEEIYTICESF